MATIVILGATGRTGRLAVRLARDAGHAVVAHGRRPVPEADLSLVGDFEGTALRDAVAGADAVLSCLASTRTERVCSRATRALLAAPRSAPLRYVMVAGAACRTVPERKAPFWRGVTWAMRLKEGAMLDDRDAELALLAESSARWTALRPPLLVSGWPRGRWAIDLDAPRRPWIDRADLAGALLDAMARDDLVGRAPYVSAPASWASGEGG